MSSRSKFATMAVSIKLELEGLVVRALLFYGIYIKAPRRLDVAADYIHGP